VTAVVTRHSSAEETRVAIERRFERFLVLWRFAISHDRPRAGQLAHNFRNRWFKEIVAMGEPVVPLLQRQLEKYATTPGKARPREEAFDFYLMHAVMEIKRWEFASRPPEEPPRFYTNEELIAELLDRLRAVREGTTSPDVEPGQ